MFDLSFLFFLQISKQFYHILRFVKVTRLFFIVGHKLPFKFIVFLKYFCVIYAHFIHVFPLGFIVLGRNCVDLIANT